MSVRKVFQLMADVIGHSFRVLPRRNRYGAARRIALTIAPVLRLLPYYRRRPSSLDGYREESLRMFLRTMVRAGVTFDPDIDFRGVPLPDGPALLASAHMLLDVHFTRRLYDRGQTLSAVVGGQGEELFYLGTRKLIDLIYVSPTCFLQVRTKLRQGNVVFVDLDYDREYPRCVRVDTAGGPRWISDKFLKFAAKNGSPLFFVCARIGEERRVVVTCERASSRDAAGMLREYCEFLCRETALVER
jgi:hypothetical protein